MTVRGHGVGAAQLPAIRTPIPMPARAAAARPILPCGGCAPVEHAIRLPISVCNSQLNSTGYLLENAEHKCEVLLFWMLRIWRERNLREVTQIHDVVTIGAQILHQAGEAKTSRCLLLADLTSTSARRNANESDLVCVEC
jgi:hypothetical protein